MERTRRSSWANSVDLQSVSLQIFSSCILLVFISMAIYTDRFAVLLLVQLPAVCSPLLSSHWHLHFPDLNSCRNWLKLAEKQSSGIFLGQPAKTGWSIFSLSEKSRRSSLQLTTERWRSGLEALVVGSAEKSQTAWSEAMDFSCPQPSSAWEFSGHVLADGGSLCCCSSVMCVL